MMGMGSTFTITPLRSGIVFICVAGSMRNNTANAQFAAALRWGTGTAPVNGAASIGTAFIEINAHSAFNNQLLPACYPGIITGLTPGTAIWFDLQLRAINPCTASLIGMVGTAFELP
jgi:hypothetical protein